MKTFLSLLMALRNDKSGATAIEYALIVGVLVLVVVGAAVGAGDTLIGYFDGIGTVVEDNGGTPPAES